MARGKSTVLGLRISDADQERIREAASARGQNVSEYVRSIVEASMAPTSRSGHRTANTAASQNQATGIAGGGQWANGTSSITLTSGDGGS